MTFRESDCLLPASSEIQLTVPATAEFLRVARVTASGLCSRIGFSIDDVDDLRLALDELCYSVIGKGSPDAQLHLRYQISASSLAIWGRVAGANGPSGTGLGEFSRQILTALVDDHQVWDDNGAMCFSLTKQRFVGAQ